MQYSSAKLSSHIVVTQVDDCLKAFIKESLKPSINEVKNLHVDVAVLFKDVTIDHHLVDSSCLAFFSEYVKHLGAVPKARVVAVFPGVGKLAPIVRLDVTRC